ncbi:probable phenol hydroxylase [Cephalotrichum gorgonifer]|uniref:Probable phenol hydroxylase n=1 Tax=Cephalotrichum gorgonifer TaxID=2041049 RepID=A0AAE8N1F7_9PEZI|nr:probable phenol hydroxylase [Cephalotrichum gorgonifer]
MSEQTDVLICGSGSAGLSAAIWLARFGVDFKVLERRDGPLAVGQADGVQCRTVEIFESLGISEPLLQDSYHVMEITFWASKEGGIERQRLGPDTLPGLSHQPHVILNQARVNQIMIDEVERLRGNRGNNIEYGCQVQAVKIEEAASGSVVVGAYPIEVTTLKNGSPHTYRAKYVLACDGAHSTVRKSLGFKMVGDSSDAVWGVMDVYLDTNFPDIRKKTVINSSQGNLVLIPREGDNLVRFYIELPPGQLVTNTDLDYLQQRARLIFDQYEVKILGTVWWSAYSIGQRLADFFSKDSRIFLTGDACHTHSPKAGQGMNVSLQDGYNIGWKLGHVLTGRAPPELLDTYVLERQDTAAKLIEFDRFFTKLFSSSYRRENGITEEKFADKFVESGRYTAGLATEYPDSQLTVREHNIEKAASTIAPGMRFPSTPVVRFSDARPVQFAFALPSDGRWHVVVFASNLLADECPPKLQEVTSDLEKIVRSYTPAGEDVDSVINSLLVFPAPRKGLEPKHVPDFFYPRQGKLQLKCQTKVFVDDEGYSHPGCGNTYALYGIDPSRGAVVIIRPDLYVSKVCELGDSDAIRTFFEGCLSRTDPRTAS